MSFFFRFLPLKDSEVLLFLRLPRRVWGFTVGCSLWVGEWKVGRFLVWFEIVGFWG